MSQPSPKPRKTRPQFADEARHRRLAGLLLSLAGAAALAQAAPPLPALGADPARSTVSGVSSGGYMAVQLHVAHSSLFASGVGVVAGGPFNCAEGSMLKALGRCLGRGEMPVEMLLAQTRERAAQGRIDPPAQLAASRIYLFAGAKDSVVDPSTSLALQRYYRALAPQADIVLKNDVPAEHAMVSDRHGEACDKRSAKAINNCGFDLAGALLAHLYGPLQPRAEATPAASLREFDQREFGGGAHGLADRGFVYLPAACTAKGAPACRVHVVLHGCRQNEATLGSAFVQQSGYKEWAESNRLLLLFPQTSAAATNGCWDWWGYATPDPVDREAPQLRGIAAMVKRLSSTRP